MPPKRENNDNNNNNNNSNKTHAMTGLADASNSAHADNNHNHNHHNHHNNNSSNNNNNSNSHYDSTATDQADQRHQLYEVNAKLCDQVKKCPWMYDRTHPNYNKKKILDKSWAKIAKECNDSVASCKDRWRNIRAAFARSVNLYKTHSGPNRVKPYYLATELQFLVKPMSENRTKLENEHENNKDESDDYEEDETNASVDDVDDVEDVEDGDKDDVEEEEDDEEIEQTDEDVKRRSHTNELPAGAQYPLLEVLYNLPARQPTTHAELSLEPELQRPKNTNYSSHQLKHENEQAVGEAAMLPCKRRIMSQAAGAHQIWPQMSPTTRLSPPSSSDADLQFLLTLLPDMLKMNMRQKVVFKSKLYQGIEDVFSNVADFPYCAASVPPSPPSQSCQSTNSKLKEAIVNNINNMSESDLFNLNNYLHQQQQHQQEQQQLAVNNRGNMKMINTIIPHTATATTPGTTTTTALTNGRATNRSNIQKNNNNKNNNRNSVWQQLQPIAIKEEIIDDIDDVDVD